MGDTIFLLGAGASRDARLPLMPELTAGFKDWLSGQKGADSAEHRLYDAAIGAVSAGSGYPNIELVLELLADLETFKGPRNAKTVQTWNLPFDADAKSVAALAALIREYIRHALSATDAPGDYLSGLMDFGDRDSKQRSGPLHVFTLNYDRLVESMATQFGYRFTSGFGEAWDPSLFDLDTWDMCVYKIHGSVDWYRLSSKNIIYRGSATHPAFPRDTAEEVLLYPARGKAAHADPFATLMSRLNQALAQANLCISIGYSFRDTHIRRAILDRMVTNRELQLLIVNPAAEEVMSLPPDEKDEPHFGQFRDRISGLAMGAKEALENRAIVQRLTEINQVDRELALVLTYRNQGNFDAAANQLCVAMDYARAYGLPYKPVGVLRSQTGTAFNDALARAIAHRFPGKSVSGSHFETSATSSMVSALANYVSLWALAHARSLPIAAAIKEEIGAILKQYASNVLFVGGAEYVMWYGGRQMEDKANVLKREADLAAIVQELRLHPPFAALAVADAQTRSDFDALVAGVNALAAYYRELGTSPLGRRRIGNTEATVPARLAIVGTLAILAEQFHQSGAPRIWLPSPDARGPVSKVQGKLEGE